MIITEVSILTGSVIACFVRFGAIFCWPLNPKITESKGSGQEDESSSSAFSLLASTHHHQFRKTRMMLSEVEKDRIRNYKYRGGDSSPIYIHVLSPLAQFCVDTFVPKFVAPNVITVSGLILSILTGILALLYNPTLSRDAPRWLHLLTAITIFSYQTLDNMDGKQARRTGSSSALGMFFDHACDCINAGVTIVSMGSVMGTGWTPTFFITYLAAFYPFYGQTWEEFYSKEMVLPPFNGPTEGLLMSIGICLIAFVNGSDIFWIDLFNAPEYLFVPDDSLLNNFGYPSPSQPMVRPFALMFSIIICAVLYTAIVHVCSVISIVTRPDSHYSILSALYTLVPFLVYFPCLYIFGFCCEQGFKTNPISLVC